MLHIRRNDYQPKQYTFLQDKVGQVISLLGVPFYSTVYNVISRHCGKVEGRVRINGSWQKVKQISRGYWEAI